MIRMPTITLADARQNAIEAIKEQKRKPLPAWIARIQLYFLRRKVQRLERVLADIETARHAAVKEAHQECIQKISAINRNASYYQQGTEADLDQAKALIAYYAAPNAQYN